MLRAVQNTPAPETQANDVDPLEAYRPFMKPLNQGGAEGQNQNQQTNQTPVDTGQILLAAKTMQARYPGMTETESFKMVRARMTGDEDAAAKITGEVWSRKQVKDEKDRKTELAKVDVLAPGSGSQEVDFDPMDEGQRQAAFFNSMIGKA